MAMMLDDKTMEAAPDLYLLTEVIAEIMAEFDADIDGQVREGQRGRGAH
jgi:hypothetical protein